jgi:hypothetical protein
MRNNVKTSLYLFFTALLSVGIVFILYLRSYRINTSDNGFRRFFPPHFITDLKSSELPFDLCYVAGFTDSTIYLGKYQYPTNVLKTNYVVSKIEAITLNYKSIRKIAWTLVKVVVDSPNTYIMEGLSPNIIKGNMVTSQNVQIAPANLYFDFCIPQSGFSFIDKRFDLKVNSNILERIDTARRLKLSYNLNSGTGKSDMFTSDGMLNFDWKSRNLVFVYFHSNEFLRLDTNLNLIFKGRTIDTIAHPNIKIGYIASERYTTYSSPPLVVNRRSCITENWLFVNSTLRANNQDNLQFSLSSTIDIYSLLDGRYLYSFYLPKYEKEEMTDFKVHGDKIITLYHHYIVIYKMNFNK